MAECCGATELQAQQQQPAAAEDEMPHLPIEVLALIVKALPRAELATLRLSSTQFAAAVTPLLDSIVLRAWPDKACSLKRLQHATRLNLDMSLPGACKEDASSARESSTSSSMQGSSSSSKICAADAEELWQQLEQLVSFTCQDVCSTSALQNH
jgi:hypothetical protein